MTRISSVLPRLDRTRAIRMAAWLAMGLSLLLIAAALWRSSTFRSHDLLVIRNAAAVWLVGQDPYDPANGARNWQSSSLPAYLSPTVQTFQVIVPPSAILLAAPLALLAPNTAIAVATGFNIAALLASAICLWKLLGLPPRSPAAIWILALAFGLPGSHDTILAGQTSGLVLLLFLLHLLLLRQNKTLAAGALLGLALALKPHLLLGALVVHLSGRQFKPLLIAALLVAALNAAMLLHLGASPAQSLRHWHEQVAQSTQSGAINDFASPGRPKYGFVNLQLPIYLATGSRALANATAMATALAILLLAIWRNWRSRQAPSLGLWAVAIGASLLPVYHRGYDAVMLLLPLAWASTQFTNGRWLLPAIAAILPPVISILRAQRLAPIDPTNYTAKALWGPAIAWSVLLCTAACLLLLWRQQGPSATTPQEQDHAAPRALA